MDGQAVTSGGFVKNQKLVWNGGGYAFRRFWLPVYFLVVLLAKEG